MRHAARLLLVPVLVFASGCITADVKIEADGSGTLEATFDPILPTDEAKERSAFQAPGVTVQEVTLGELRTGIAGQKVPESIRVRASFTDVTKLPQAPRLARYGVEISDAGEGMKLLRVTLKPQSQGKGFDHPKPVTIRIQLPGDVVESSAKIEGRTVVWTFPAPSYIGPETMKLEAKYKVAAAPAAGTGSAPTGAKLDAPPPAKSPTPAGY